MTTLEGLKLRLQIYEDTYDSSLNEILSTASDFICMYTGRTSVSESLDMALVRIAAILYRRKKQNDSVHRDSLANILPDDLHQTLNRWRIPVSCRLQRRG